MKLLADYLNGLGVDFIMTREPGGSEISEEIRKIILNKNYDKMCDECEALLYAAARIQHLREKIAPALARGTLVICFPTPCRRKEFYMRLYSLKVFPQKAALKRRFGQEYSVETACELS